LNPISFTLKLSFNVLINSPADGHLLPKHVARYNQFVITASCLDVRWVLTVRIIVL